MVMCNICSSSFHISDACPILLDTAFCGETQFVGNFQGQYYQEQNSYLAEQPIWSHPQFQQIDSLVVEPQLSLEEMIKQIDENHKQRDEQIQSSLQSLAVQVEKIVSTAHQLQEKKMFHDDVQPVALLEVMQCDTSLEETPAIVGEEILMPTTTCARIQKKLIVVEFDTKSVDVSSNQQLPIVENLLVESLIKPRNMQLSFAICASLPPILSVSQANSELCDFHAFAIAGLPYVHAIPPKPPDFSLISKFTCYLLFPIPRVRSLEMPPRKPPDMKDKIPP
ncbi:hypothetical protein QL285_009019 [Trifolium repens]|nr:hypothetical protein QL285_009019 [Trifolium repens]